MKDDSGSYAVFTERGSSASQMAAAKVMDIISRLPEYAGRAADAVSAHSRVKMEDAPTLLKIPKSECPKSWCSMEDLVIPLDRNLYGHPLAGLFWEMQFEKVLLTFALGESFQLGMLIRTPRKRAILVCVFGRYKTLERNKISTPLWKILMKDVLPVS